MLAEVESSATSLGHEARLTLKVFQSLAAAEAPWRAFEEHAVLTPYQRFDWIQPLVAACGIEDEIAVIAILAAGSPIALLPLHITRRSGFKLASLIGSNMGNSDWMPVDPTGVAVLSLEALRVLLREIAARVGGIDCFTFANQPAAWQGVKNPLLAFPHQTASDNFYYAPIGPDAEVLLTKKRRVDIVRGKRRLEESFGPISVRRADTPEDIRKAHALFLEHRKARFAVMGVDNVFARPDYLNFFRLAAGNSIGAPRPAFCFHTLHAGDEIVATACSAYCGTHYSQYINSNTDGPASRYSLVGLLMLELMQDLEKSGTTSIDLGIGDFAYKTSWTAPMPVYDSVIPITRLGALAAPVWRGAAKAKAAIKHNPKLFAAAKRLRLVLKRQPHTGAEA